MSQNTSQDIIEIKVRNSPFSGEIDLPGSKSIINRVLLLAALAEGQSLIKNFLFSDDTEAMLEALKALGVYFEINRDKKEVIINGCDGKFPNIAVDIFTRDSGTTTRFLIPVLAAQERGVFTIRASERMSLRPLKEILKAIELLGAMVVYHEKPYSMPLTIYASGLNGGELEVSTKDSTQFLSGLLMAAPLFKAPIIFKKSLRNFYPNAEIPINPISPSNLISLCDSHNQSYVKMSVDLMKKFGADIQDLKQDLKEVRDCNHQYLVIPGKYKNQEIFYIEPDLSTASYFFAAAAITGGEVEILNISQKSLQGDLQFLNILSEMGAEIIYKAGSILLRGPQKSQGLKGVFINMRNISDTFMTLAAVACFAASPTEIRGIAHTRLQESDRIDAMII
jgi:3-phosphoshikimate 1-carboxyvinyltransferase